MNVLDEIKHLVEEYAGRIAGLKIKIGNPIAISSLQKSKRWDDWSGKPGVYYFVCKGKVAYIGRALSSTLGGRINDQMRSLQDKSWAEVVTNLDTLVGFIEFPDGESYWVASLEIFLIQKLLERPLHNKKIG